jgi:hypothetical protein
MVTGFIGRGNFPTAAALRAVGGHYVCSWPSNYGSFSPPPPRLGNCCVSDDDDQAFVSHQQYFDGDHTISIGIVVVVGTVGVEQGSVEQDHPG